MQLSDFSSDLESDIHPTRQTRVEGVWHYFFFAGSALIAGCCVWGFFHREWLRESITSCSLKSPLDIVSIGLLVTGGILFVFLCCRGSFGNESSAFFDGYSTYPRKILYTSIGVFAVLVVGYLVEQFRSQLKKCTWTGEQNSLTRKSAMASFGDTHFVKVSIIALVLAFAGWVFVYDLYQPGFWVPASVAFLILTIGLVMVGRNSNTQNDHSGAIQQLEQKRVENWVLGPHLRGVICFALGVMVVLLFIGLLGHLGWLGEKGEMHGGWHHVSTSRGAISQIGDWVVSEYAFGTVGLLLSSLLFMHIWSREFANHAKYVNDNRLIVDQPVTDASADEEDVEFQQGLASIAAQFGGGEATSSGTSAGAHHEHFEYERLHAIGKLTAVTGQVAPILMALLFALVITYHPWLSPEPMPLSLLVLTSLFMVAYIVSVLSLRWHFAMEKEQALADLHKKLWELKVPQSPGENSNEESTVAQSKNLQESSEVVQEFQVRDVITEGRSVGLTLVLESPPKKKEAIDGKEKLEIGLEKIDSLSEGVFRSWNKSPIGWVFGSGAVLAIVDLWIRWWMIGL